MKVLLFATFAASTVAFIPTSNKVESNALLAVKEKSGALPFLPYPENLRGYVGEEIGFDPLRISDYFPMDYLREAELKHSRIAMLAITGFIAVDLGFTLPFAQGVSSADAHNFGVEQGLFGAVGIPIGVFEMVSWLAVQEMLQGSGREPGNFGFGLKYLDGKSEENIKKVKMWELLNGRLAMFAIGGAATQSVLTGHGFPYV
mmetsp:Transcript_24206/g.27585  ORF Transcript_24206/g.27585 Transcript_24206/m.27585 type:complete len:202 (+) Transcript_24206:158-763(+)